MLRRRILASAMASVMAIGSVAVVASAEDTAAATTQMKTKADLEAYVKTFEGFRSKEINDYASKSGERFLDALEYADVVIDDTASTVDDYTVAYQMITATYNQLKVYTAEELSALIKANKSKYETNNIYNDDLNDAIYKNEDGKLQWDTFVTAYDDANDVLNSKDSRIISDAYEALEDAAANLALLDTVTKSQFRAALKSYEQLKQKVYDYDTWRRGTLPGWVDFKTGEYWKFNGGTNISFGALYSALTVGEKNNGAGWYDQYELLDGEKSVTKTSDTGMVTAYRDLLNAVDLMSNWTADDTNRASKSSVNALINDYRGVLVHDFHNDNGNNSAIDLYNAILAGGTTIEVSQSGSFVPSNAVLDPWERTFETVDTKNYEHQCNWDSKIGCTGNDVFGYNSTLGEYMFSVTKMTSASIKVKSTSSAIYIPVDKDGIWTGEAISTKRENSSYKLFAKNSVIDLTQFISVNGYVTDAQTNAATLETAASTTSGAKVDEAIAPIAKTIAATEKKAAAVKEAKLAEFAGDNKKIKAANSYFGGLERALKNYKSVVAEQSKVIEAITGSFNKGKTYTSADLADAYRAVAVAYDNLAAYLAGGSELANYQKNTNDWALLGTWATPNLAEEFAALADDFAAFQAAVEKLHTEMFAANANVQPDTTVVNNAGTMNEYIDATSEYLLSQNWMMPAIGTGKVQATVNASSAVENVQVRLDDAMALAELYMKGDKEEIKDSSNPLYAINTTDEIAAGSAKASTAEWTIVYRYLKYALADKYNLSEAKYTKADVVALLEKSYDLAEKTGDAALFEKTHNILVTARKAASDWVASANKDKKYKDGKVIDKRTATQVYENLNTAYENLNKDYEAFKYSFGEIYTNLSAYAEMLDEGELQATDELKKTMEETAYRLSIVGSMENDIDIAIENDAYDADRKFLDYNRVYTKGTGDGWTLIGTDMTVPKPQDNSVMMSHYNLRTAYEALQAEVKKQTEVKTLLGDVNGDGVVNALDAAAILKAVVNNTAIDVAVGDFNADGAVNALDASAILKYVVSQA